MGNHSVISSGLEGAFKWLLSLKKEPMVSSSAIYSVAPTLQGKAMGWLKAQILESNCLFILSSPFAISYDIDQVTCLCPHVK